MRICLFFFYFLLPLQTFALSETFLAQVPTLRFKLGTSTLTLDAGEVIQEEPLNATATLQPTVLWDWPSFSSRVGIHFLTDLNSAFGLMPISGMGISAYLYPLGISTAYEVFPDETIQQKSKPSFYFYGGLTPVNLSISQSDETNPRNNIYFNAFVIDLSLGMGFDYPIQENLVVSLEINHRRASATGDENENGAISYSGLGLMLSFLTTYY